MHENGYLRALRLLREAEAEVDWLRRQPLLEEALRLAEQVDSLPLAYSARVSLVEATVLGGRIDRAFEHIAWCLEKAARHPDEVDAAYALWQYKWLANKLCRFPTIRREKIEFVLQDLAARFEDYGWGARAPHQMRMENAVLTGDRDEAARACARWQATPRGPGSDCEGCEQDRLVEFHVFMGDEAAALRAAEPILRGELRCGEVPHITLPRVLIPLLRTGQPARAFEFHRQGYQLAATPGDFLGALAEHLVYCALTRAVHRGAAILTRHLVLTFENPDTLDCYRFYRAGYLLLRAMARQGAQMPSVLPAPAPQDLHDLDNLMSWFEEEAASRAESLDQRNGRDYFRTELGESDALLDEAWPSCPNDCI